MAIKLSYFDIQGAAEPVRLALVLAGKEFEDDRIAFDKWPEVKPTTKFGQVPVMKIGDKTMAQSGAMMRLIGKSYAPSLYPQEGDAFIAVEEAIGLVDDFIKAWVPAFYIGMAPQYFGYSADFMKTEEGKALLKKLREEFVKEALPRFMKFFGDLIEANKGFLCGDKPTIADCLLLPHLRKYTMGHIDYVSTDCLEGFPVITAYIKRMMEIPAIKEWYAKAK